ncbi:MAG TPA: YfhO family protein [Flavobacterium sp.]|jgi:hypothetical protein
MKKLNRFYPHAFAVFGFIVFALIYFYPVLQGKKIYQSDIAQYTGMAKEQNDFRAAENVEPFWTNSSFGGMPTYQLGAKYPHDYIGMIDDALRFLPRPADYLFLYFAGFYILLLVLKADPLKAFLGALAFGFSTYLIVILGVGHNAKAHAIAYMPMVVAGFLLVFQRRYILGGFLTLFAAALEINANHFQMTYYLLLLLLVITIYYVVEFVKQKAYKPLLTAFGVFIAAGLLAVGSNATNLLATAEYADFSIRGKSELTFNPDGSPNKTTSSMDYDYITEYSYGVGESLNLIAPRLFGGGNEEKLGEESHVYEFLIGYGASAEEALQTTQYYGRTYWGDQPIVAAPAYIGAVVFYLAVLALYHDNRKIKYAFLAGALLSLLLSWGKNFPLLTNFFIDYVPMYDKFRAVSSIQVVLELCLPALAIMGLHSFFTSDKDKQWPSLWKSAATCLGLVVGLFLFKGVFFDFTGPVDDQLIQLFSQGQDKGFGSQFIEALQNDRKSLYAADLLRSGFFIAVTAGVLWMSIKNRLAHNTAIIIVGVFMISDLFFVAKNYVDSKDFVSAREVDIPFQPTPSDQQILSDKGHYRVFEIDAIHNARTSYFHKSISGYSAVRPRRMEELLEYQIAKNNIGVLNMLNTKYIIQTDEKGQQFPVENPGANGNAWFVANVLPVKSADQEMKALDSLDSGSTAVVNTTEFKVVNKTTFARDSAATITLEQVRPNYLKYVSSNANEGFALFSEIYYPKGWTAFIDGKPTEHFRADYVLRAMFIPAGKHTIEFKFEPQVVKTGSTIALISTILIVLLLVGGIYYEKKRRAAHSEAI